MQVAHYPANYKVENVLTVAATGITKNQVRLCKWVGIHDGCLMAFCSPSNCPGHSTLLPPAQRHLSTTFVYKFTGVLGHPQPGVQAGIQQLWRQDGEFQVYGLDFLVCRLLTILMVTRGHVRALSGLQSVFLATVSNIDAL